MTYSNEWLIRKYRRGERLKYLFFWGHQPAADGRVTQSCFSQWWPAPFTIDGIRYATAEHWMMAEKARLFGDEAARQEILAAGSPAAAKKLGRTVLHFDAAAWDRQKSAIVIRGNLQKFAGHPDLAAYLSGTGDRILVEASPADAVWGIGLAADHEHIHNPLKWRGRNLLGYALMTVRDHLKNIHPIL